MERLFCFYKCVSIIVCVDYIQERMSYLILLLSVYLGESYRGYISPQNFGGRGQLMAISQH